MMQTKYVLEYSSQLLENSGVTCGFVIVLTLTAAIFFSKLLRSDFKKATLLFDFFDQILILQMKQILMNVFRLNTS